MKQISRYSLEYFNIDKTLQNPFEKTKETYHTDIK